MEETIMAEAVSDFLKVRGQTTRSEFARSRGIPPGTFDGWYWKAIGVARGRAKEPSAIAAAANRVEPMGYLRWVLSNRAAAEADPKSFLPWSDKVPEDLRF